MKETISIGSLAFLFSLFQYLSLSWQILMHKITPAFLYSSDLLCVNMWICFLYFYSQLNGRQKDWYAVQNSANRRQHILLHIELWIQNKRLCQLSHTAETQVMFLLQLKYHQSTVCTYWPLYFWLNSLNEKLCLINIHNTVPLLIWRIRCQNRWCGRSKQIYNSED